MSQFVLTLQAEIDLNDIWEYIARDSVGQADRVLARIEKTFRSLSLNPNLGRIREEWADARHKFWPIYSYIIMYRYETKPLQIISGYFAAGLVEPVPGQLLEWPPD